MTDDAEHATRTRPRRSEPDAGHRPPPHDLSAEDALLGAAMLSTDALATLATKTEPGDFYSPGNGHVAHAMRRLFEAGHPADAVTVADELRRTGTLDQAGGRTRLAEMMATAPVTRNAGRYAVIVHDHATRRRLMRAAAEITQGGYEGTSDAHDAVLKAQALIEEVASQNGARAYSTLDVADVAALLDGNLEAEEADILRRNDGKALFYAGKMHVIQAEPSSGKSWIALAAAKEILDMGGAVLYLDYEDTSTGILGRLLALGALPANVRARFRYVQPVAKYGPNERIELDRIMSDLNPDLVVIDGVAEALARDGYSEDRNAEVIAWIETLPRPLARTGAAVVMLDHVVKNREEQGRWARGASAKLGAVDGASYGVKVIVPFTRQKRGTLRLVIAKDRPGGVGAVGDTAAIVDVNPLADGARVLLTLGPDTGQTRTTDTWKPTILMRQASAELAKCPEGLSVTALKSLIHTDKPKLVTEAISRLLQEGYFAEGRKGRGKILRSIRPYLEGGDPGPTGPAETVEERPLFDADIPNNVTRGPWPEGEEEF